MPPNNDGSIEDEALGWLITATSGGMTPQQERSLTDWLAQNPAHQQAFAEAQALWQGLGQLQERPFVADNLAKMEVERVSPANATVHPIKPAYAKRTFPLSQLMLVAACLAMVAVLCPTMTSSLKLWNADYHTAIGEQQNVTLADGSSIYMNAASALNQDYSPGQRRIELLAGEAEFKVSKDKSRPFVVVADNQEIKALGTDFVVKITSQGIRVSVAESAVQVSQPGQSSIEPVIVHTGEQVYIPAGHRPDPIAAININHASPWRSDRLIFESEPLSQVVEDINRYRPGHVFLSRPSLAELRVSGVFSIQEIDNLLGVIGKTLPVKSISLTDKYVVLY
ncbi:MAG: FecR family protein [Methyloglobulus sp.]|nr:FecR family protein [Methyloglobulus sp.]